jgi:hypothetical protein
MRRPTTLSTMGCCYSEAELAAILRKRDDELDWSDFRAIFAVSDCGPTRQERAWFVPSAAKYLTERPSEGLEFISGFIAHFSRNSGDVPVEYRVRDAEAVFDGLLDAWTARFTIVHFDRAACEAKGWSIPYHDYVMNSQILTDVLEALVLDPALSVIGERFIRRLQAQDTLTASQWFLELARAVQQCDVDFIAHAAKAKRASSAADALAMRVQDVLTTPAVLAEMYARVHAARSVDDGETYWCDVRSLLGLDAAE